MKKNIFATVLVGLACCLTGCGKQQAPEHPRVSTPSWSHAPEGQRTTYYDPVYEVTDDAVRAIELQAQRAKNQIDAAAQHAEDELERTRRSFGSAFDSTIDHFQPQVDAVRDRAAEVSAQLEEARRDRALQMPERSNNDNSFFDFPPPQRDWQNDPVPVDLQDQLRGLIDGLENELHR